MQANNNFVCWLSFSNRLFLWINLKAYFELFFGLAYGLEFNSLRDQIGGSKESLELYRQFKDPQSSIGKKEYSFMCIGPTSPLAVSSVPLFINTLSYPEEFAKINGLDK